VIRQQYLPAPADAGFFLSALEHTADSGYALSEPARLARPPGCLAPEDHYPTGQLGITHGRAFF
jgi:hypothetical protein